VSRHGSRVGHRLANLLLAAALLAVAAVTLVPTPQPGVDPGPRILFFGGLADLLRNVILFAPVGIALALRGAGVIKATLLALPLAAGIELAQLAIPGRTASPHDALANTLGALLGAALVRSALRWLSPSPAAAAWLVLLAALAFSASVAETGRLTVPELPDGKWYAHWNPDLGPLRPYTGPVNDARIGKQELVHGRVDRPDRARADLAAGEPLELLVSYAGPSPGFEGIFLLTDESNEELGLVAIDDQDLIYRLRSRASVLGLEPALMRVPRAWRGVAAGDVSTVRVWRADPDACIALDAEIACGLGFSAAQSWRLILPVLWLPAQLEPAFDAAWLAGLALPVGLWSRRNKTTLLAIALCVAALVALPGRVGLMPTPWHQFLAAAAGWWIGAAIANRQPAAEGR
jgi:VanZ family protein